MRDASFFAALKTVLAGLIGVRRRADHERETARINPVHVIVAGIIVAALLVATLIAIVRFVVG